MRIFHSFLVIMAAIILLMLPITQSAYAFRTDVKTNTFNVSTPVATTNATVVLLNHLYDDNINTVAVTSNTSESPIPFSWDSSTKSLIITGLSANVTHSLVVSYDVAAFATTNTISILLDKLPFIWMLIVVAFAPAALVAIFMGKA